MKKCAIILINYNTAALSLAAIQSVLQFTQTDFELIVVDNASRWEDYMILKKGCENSAVRLVRSRINTGFGGGNMFGIQFAHSSYYIFLNSDTLLTEDSISKLVAFMDSNEQAAIAAPLVTDEKGVPRKAYDFALSLRQELLGEGFLRLFNPKKYPDRKKRLTRPTKVDAVLGSFFICRAADFDAAGGFDTNLFLYYEEKDLAYRITHKLKKAIYIFAGTTYIHFKGKSTGDNFLTKKELRISQLYCIRKNLGNFKYLIFYGCSLLKFMVKSPFSKKNRKYLSLFLKGAGLSHSLKHQQKIQPE